MLYGLSKIKQVSSEELPVLITFTKNSWVQTSKLTGEPWLPGWQYVPEVGVYIDDWLQSVYPCLYKAIGKNNLVNDTK